MSKWNRISNISNTKIDFNEKHTLDNDKFNELSTNYYAFKNDFIRLVDAINENMADIDNDNSSKFETVREEIKQTEERIKKNLEGSVSLVVNEIKQILKDTSNIDQHTVSNLYNEINRTTQINKDLILRSVQLLSTGISEINKASGMKDWTHNLSRDDARILAIEIQIETPSIIGQHDVVEEDSSKLDSLPINSLYVHLPSTEYTGERNLFHSYKLRESNTEIVKFIDQIKGVRSDTILFRQWFNGGKNDIVETESGRLMTFNGMIAHCLEYFKSIINNLKIAVHKKLITDSDSFLNQIKIERRIFGREATQASLNLDSEKLRHIDTLNKHLRDVVFVSLRDEKDRFITELERNYNVYSGYLNSNVRRTKTEIDNKHTFFLHQVNDAKTIIETKTEAFNTLFETKTEAFNTTVETKTDDFDANAVDKEREFDSNFRVKHTVFDINVDSKTDDFNEHVENKIGDFHSYVVNKEGEFNSYFVDKKREFNSYFRGKKVAFNTTVETKTEAFNTLFETKTEAFNTTVETKTNDFNSNFVDKEREFDSYIRIKEVFFNRHVDSKTDDFNEHVENKIGDFHSHVVDKERGFDSYVGTKTVDFNSHIRIKEALFNRHVDSKTEDFNKHVENKIGDFHSHVVDKKREFDSYVRIKEALFNRHVDSKTEDFDEHVENKTGEFTKEAEKKKGDLTYLSEFTKDEIENKKEEFNSFAKNLKTDIDALRTDTNTLRADSNALRTDTNTLRADSNALRADINAHVVNLTNNQNQFNNYINTIQEQSKNNILATAEQIQEQSENNILATTGQITGQIIDALKAKIAKEKPNAEEIVRFLYNHKEQILTTTETRMNELYEEYGRQLYAYKEEMKRELESFRPRRQN